MRIQGREAGEVLPFFVILGLTRDPAAKLAMFKKAGPRLKAGGDDGCVSEPVAAR